MALRYQVVKPRPQSPNGEMHICLALTGTEFVFVSVQSRTRLLHRKSFPLFCRFCLEEPPGVQRVYDRPSTPPPTKVICLSDKEQKDWVKDVQGITEQ